MLFTSADDRPSNHSDLSADKLGQSLCRLKWEILSADKIRRDFVGRFYMSDDRLLPIKIVNLTSVLDSNLLHLYLTHWSTQFGDVPEVLAMKQPFWDRPGVLADKALVEASLNGNRTTRGHANSPTANSHTSQVADNSTRAQGNSQTRQLADKHSRRRVNSPTTC